MSATHTWSRGSGQTIELAVGDAREEAVQAGEAAIDLPRPGPQARGTHEASNAPDAHPHAGGGEGMVDAGAAVRVTAAREDGLDLLEEGAVLALARAGPAASPRVVAGPGDSVEGAEPSHGEPLTLRLDEREDLRFRAEENRMAFFKSSCSSFSSACSRFSVCSCLISRADREGISTRRGRPLSAPSRTSLRQRDSMKGWMSRALATVCSSTPGM